MDPEELIPETLLHAVANGEPLYTESSGTGYVGQPPVPSGVSPDLSAVVRSAVDDYYLYAVRRDLQSLTHFIRQRLPDNAPVSLDPSFGDSPSVYYVRIVSSTVAYIGIDLNGPSSVDYARLRDLLQGRITLVIANIISRARPRSELYEYICRNATPRSTVYLDYDAQERRASIRVVDVELGVIEIPLFLSRRDVVAGLATMSRTWEITPEFIEAIRQQERVPQSLSPGQVADEEVSDNQASALLYLLRSRSPIVAAGDGAGSDGSPVSTVPIRMTGGGGSGVSGRAASGGPAGRQWSNIFDMPAVPGQPADYAAFRSVQQGVQQPAAPVEFARLIPQDLAASVLGVNVWSESLQRATLGRFRHSFFFRNTQQPDDQLSPVIQAVSVHRCFWAPELRGMPQLLRVQTVVGEDRIRADDIGSRSVVANVYTDAHATFLADVLRDNLRFRFLLVIEPGIITSSDAQYHKGLAAHLQIMFHSHRGSPSRMRVYALDLLADCDRPGGMPGIDPLFAPFVFDLPGNGAVLSRRGGLTYDDLSLDDRTHCSYLDLVGRLYQVRDDLNRDGRPIGLTPVENHAAAQINRDL